MFRVIQSREFIAKITRGCIAKMMMDFTVPSSRCVTILVTATLLLYNIQICAASDEKLPYGGTAERRSVTSSTFGDENIKVYTIYYPLDRIIEYETLDDETIKKAMEHWETIKETGLETRKRRDDKEIHDYEKMKEMSETLVKTYESKRDAANVTFYPTVLTILDYDIDWPTNENDKKRVMNEQILYALAFWGGVEHQLKHIPRPKVSLRLGAIVICLNRRGAWYIKNNSQKGKVNMEKSLEQAQSHLNVIPDDYRQFLETTAHFIAVLTQHPPQFLPDAISTSHGLCDDSDFEFHIPITIISDNHAFDGLQLAIQQVVKLMGVTSYDNGDNADGISCVDEKFTIMTDDVRYLGRKWSPCTLAQLECDIETKSCLLSPKMNHVPGKPIERILPGHLYRALQQCKAQGFNPGFVCWNKLSCQELVCAQSDSWMAACIRLGAPPDGTTCGSGKLCLDGKCIDEPSPI